MTEQKEIKMEVSGKLRITYLKLVNFIGILHGTGKHEIEIDFERDIRGVPMNNNKIVMLLGENGSGKTTILSQLHPFKRSFDDRKTVTIPGKDGLKEIHIVDGDNKYEITHTYPANDKAAKSFCKKNGEEINPTGSVTALSELLQKELGVTTDYFNIGKIGSNVSNFVDATPSERNNYINSLCADAEKYTVAFGIIKDRHKTLKEYVKIISGEMEGLYSKPELEERIAAGKIRIEAEEEKILAITDELSKSNALDEDLLSKNEIGRAHV